MLSNLLNTITDFILPPVCLCCESPLESTNGSIIKFICPECYGNLERFNIIHPWKNEYIAAGTIDGSNSAFWFRDGTPIQTLMHEMKYCKLKSIGRLFGREIGNLINSLNIGKIDYVIPVPLHNARRRDRTYNQSEFIAEGAAGIIGADVLFKALKRTRYTGTQTKLNKPQRKENVKDAFAVNPEFSKIICNKNILLVDDVITTGATILECAAVLKAAGAGKILVCSAAYAELKDTSEQKSA
jgi:ComF family protein